MGDLSHRLGHIDPKDLAALSNRLLAAQQQAPARTRNASTAQIPRRSATGPVPLTAGQQRIWFRELLSPDNAGNNVLTPLRIEGPLDPDVLERCVRAIQERHNILRATVVSDGDVPHLAIHATCPMAFTRVDLTGNGEDIDAANIDATVQEHIRVQLERPFELTSEPPMRATLLRVGATSWVFLPVFHHLAFDHASQQRFLSELGTVYDSLRRGAGVGLPPLRIQFDDYAAWEHERLTTDVVEKQTAFWENTLDGVEFTLALPTDLPRPQMPMAVGRELVHPIPDGVAAAARTLAQEMQVSLVAVLLGVFELVAARMAGNERFVLGYPMANRSRPGTETLIGMLASDLLIRADVAGEKPGSAFVRHVHEAMLAVQEHADVPLHELLHPKRTGVPAGSGRVIPVAFNYMSASREKLTLPDLSVEVMERNADNTTPLDLYFCVVETASGLELTLTYDLDLYRPSTMTLLAEAYVSLLTQLVEAPERSIGALETPPAFVAWCATAERPLPPSETKGATKASFAAPETPIQGQLAEIWEELLDLDQVGVDDDFFLLGGHSLVGTVLVSRIRTVFGVDVPLAIVFDQPTVRGLAAAVEDLLLGSLSDAELADALSELDGLTDEEVAALLEEENGALRSGPTLV